MIEEYFKEVGITLVELPIELVDDRPVYGGYLKELPVINATGESRKIMHQKLASMYQAYREQLLTDMEIEKEKTMNLSTEELLRYMMVRHSMGLPFLLTIMKIILAKISYYRLEVTLNAFLLVDNSLFQSLQF